MDRGVTVIKRALEIGDVVWVARLKSPSLSGPNELVLDYVVERKRMDDLVSSIKDGRFVEQKVNGRGEYLHFLRNALSTGIIVV